MLRAVPLVLSLALTAPLVAPVPAGAQPPSTFHEEYLEELEWAAERLQGLAGAVPAERYAWRPAEGIRSVAEAFQHVNASIYYLTRSLGVELPEGLPDDVETLEETTSKDAVVEELERALAHARESATGVAPESLDREVELFGRTTTARRVLLRLLVHLNEHTGQLVAYARSIGVTPPWSR